MTDTDRFDLPVYVADIPARVKDIAFTAHAYTLHVGDAGKYLRADDASANTVTVPPNVDVDFAVGTVLHVRQVGTGQTTLVAGAGVTLLSAETLKISKTKGTIALVKVATDTWELFGNLATS